LGLRGAHRDLLGQGYPFLAELEPGVVVGLDGAASIRTWAASNQRRCSSNTPSRSILSPADNAAGSIRSRSAPDRNAGCCATTQASSSAEVNSSGQPLILSIPLAEVAVSMTD
jgi:hypothetical protein